MTTPRQTETAPSAIGRALDNLIHQFADPWSFLREMIQNAIDAGSPEIEVNIEHQSPGPGAGADDPGLMMVEILDAGAGMDRDIIDNRLTRLFSSAKDGDYTKIGRFGIGFVSVFAIAPDLVCVDTGRSGEYWRVLFRADRSFERIRLDMPVEGTTIRIYKRGGPGQVEEARRRAAKVIEYWCKHARVEVHLDGVLVSRPMSLDADCVIEHEEEGTRLLLGLSEDPHALHGYYHGGLTLHEERSDALPHLSFKIDSRYLEHTLTRDNVIRDENYDKAMAIVARLAATRLVETLFAALEAQVLEFDPDPSAVDPAAVETLRALYGHALRERRRAAGGGQKLSETVETRRIIPTVDGPPRSLRDCRKLGREQLWTAAAASPVTAALRAKGSCVVDLRAAGEVLTDLLTLHTKRAPQRVSSVCTAIPTPGGGDCGIDSEPGGWAPLRAACAHLLDSEGARVAALRLGHLDYPESAVADRVAITQGEFGELTPIEAAGSLATGWLAGKRCVVVNADHPSVGQLLELAQTEPELAAYLLVKLLYLRAGPPEDRSVHSLDTALATTAAGTRWERRG